MKAVATFLQPTSTVSSLKTTLTEDEENEFLVVAKTCSLEIFAILPDGIRFQCSENIWGHITSVQSIPVGDNPKHNLLITTDHPDPKALLFEYVQSATSTARIKVIKTLSLHEKFSRPAEFWTGSLVERKGKVAVINSYVGKLRILEVEEGLITNDFDASIRELNLLSACFLRTTNTRIPVLAMLHINHNQQRVLTSHEVLVPEREISSSTSSFFPETVIEDKANIIIAVPPHTNSNWNTNGGILVLGGQFIRFYTVDRKQKKRGASNQAYTSNSKSASAMVSWPFSEINAWSGVDEEHTRILLGDGFGRLVLLAFDMKTQALNLLPLGETSAATSLTPLPSQFIYVTSHFGDSQLVRLVPDRATPTSSYIEVVDSYKNIAPIMDAVAEDIDNSGQPTIVTCSGGANSGSLRIIRNGANFHEDSRIAGICNIVKLWPCKHRSDDPWDNYIVASTESSTHVLKLPQTPADTEIAITYDFLTDLSRDSKTLVAGNILNRVTSQTGKAIYEDGQLFIHVTPKEIVLLNTGTGLKEDQWLPQGCDIILADISPTQILVALPKGYIRLFTVEDGKLRTNDNCLKAYSDEISAISISPQSRTSKFSKYVTLGFWRTNTVKVFSLPTFTLIHQLSMTHLPRSLLLYDFGDRSSPHTYLIVSLANGKVVLYPFSKDALGERKEALLSDCPLSLSKCEVNGQTALLASGTRSALFYWAKETLNHSAVLIKDVLASQTLSLHTSGPSIMLSTPEGLVIGRISELDKLHIRTVHMGLDNPMRIAYHRPSKTFGVGCSRRVVDNSSATSLVDESEGCFKIVDTIDFSTTHEFSLEVDEVIVSVAVVNLEYQSLEATTQETLYAVGTMYYAEGDIEPKRGRVLLFSPGSATGGHPYLFASVETKGAVYEVISVKGKLVAAINSSVHAYKIMMLEAHSNRSQAPVLREFANWDHNYVILNLIASNDNIILGDAISSLTVLTLDGTKFTTVVKDYSPLYPISLGMLDNDTVLGANSYCNLFSIKLQKRDGGGVSLENDGIYYIDETVNKLVPGGIGSTENKHDLKSKLLVFTSTGRISVVVDVGEQLSRLLSGLERNLSGLKKGPGDIDHTVWRSPANFRGRSDAQSAPVGFLDGDFLESFLDYQVGSREVERVLTGRNEAEKLEASYAELRSVLESLRSTHE